MRLLLENSVEQHGDGDLGFDEFGGVGFNGKFGLFPALNDDVGNSVQPVQTRLQCVGGQFPQLGLRKSAGGEAITDDGKGREGNSVCGDRGGCGKRGLNARDGGVDGLKCLEHVRVPVEEEVDFSGAATSDGGDVIEARHGIDSLFQRASDGDLHLVAWA